MKRPRVGGTATALMAGIPQIGQRQCRQLAACECFEDIRSPTVSASTQLATVKLSVRPQQLLQRLMHTEIGTPLTNQRPEAGVWRWALLAAQGEETRVRFHSSTSGKCRKLPRRVYEPTAIRLPQATALPKIEEHRKVKKTAPRPGIHSLVCYYNNSKLSNKYRGEQMPHTLFLIVCPLASSTINDSMPSHALKPPAPHHCNAAPLTTGPIAPPSV